MRPALPPILLLAILLPSAGCRGTTDAQDRVVSAVVAGTVVEAGAPVGAGVPVHAAYYRSDACGQGPRTAYRSTATDDLGRFVLTLDTFGADFTACVDVRTDTVAPLPGGGARGVRFRAGPVPDTLRVTLGAPVR